MFPAINSYVSVCGSEQQLRATLLSSLASVGVVLADDELLIYPILTRPGYHVLVTADHLHESMAQVAPHLRLSPVAGYRGVWVYGQ